MPGTLAGRRNKDEINTFLQHPTDLFTLTGNILNTILKVCSKYNQNRDKNDTFPEKVSL